MITVFIARKVQVANIKISNIKCYKYVDIKHVFEGTPRCDVSAEQRHFLVDLKDIAVYVTW